MIKETHGSTPRAIAASTAACVALSLVGCADQQQSGAALGAMGQAVATAMTAYALPQSAASQGAPNPPPVAQSVATAPPAQFKRFADTKLPGLLANETSSLNAREGYPKVALIPVYAPTFHNKEANSMVYGARGGCWIFKAKIWTSAKKSEDVPEFSYCMPTDIKSKPRVGVLKTELGDVSALRCIDGRMPDNYMTTRTNGTGPYASYHIAPDGYLSRASPAPGAEQLFFMLNDMGLSPRGGAQAPCRAWVASSPWQAKDF